MKPNDIDPPPFFSTWPRLYLAVGLYLVALIAVFAFFTRTFTP